MLQLQYLKSQFQQIISDKKSKTAILVFGLSFLIVLFLDSLLKDSVDHKEVHEKDSDIATLIPAGSVLVPIILHNKDSLSSLMGDFGIVDLYQVDQQKGRGKRVAKGVKILRAPNDPNQFGVLIPENDADLVVATHQELVAVLQNRQLRENASLVRPKRQLNQVEYLQ